MIKKLCWSFLSQSLFSQSLFWLSPALLFVPLLAPLPAVAYSAEELLTVSWLPGEDYTALARRAEGVARTAAQQGFDTDILLTRVVITVLGQNGGQAAPILKLDVSRNDWRNRPDPRYWASYYRSTPALLGLEGVAPTGTLQVSPPGAAPAAPAPAPVTPAPDAAPGLIPAPAPSSPPANSSNSGSSTIRSPGRSVNRPAAQSGNQSDNPDNQPANSSSPPAINLPAVPAGVGIPRSILR